MPIMLLEKASPSATPKLLIMFLLGPIHSILLKSNISCVYIYICREGLVVGCKKSRV